MTVHCYVRRTTFRRTPRRVRLAAGTLILPPVSLRDLPPGGHVGSFMSVAALCFPSRGGALAVFLHDLPPADIETILEAQRHAAEAQLGFDYAKALAWWERA